MLEGNLLHKPAHVKKICPIRFQ